MTYKILVTGGAGFIGSHITDGLIEKGHDVTILDALVPQVHSKKPDYLNTKATFIKGDVSDKKLLLELMQNHEVVYHEASAVGVGQSMYQIEDYVRENTLNTAILLDLLANKENSIKKLVVAASMSSYGEGKYSCADCGIVYPKVRDEAQLARRDWELNCPSCGKKVKPLPTDETKPRDSTSIYAITKKDQEEMCLVVGKSYGIPTVALRYFNAYGPRQALSNPYTGVCAIFSCRIRNGKPPVIFEDGCQTRDFLHVKDIVQANILALEKNRANYEAFNVGSGTPASIKDIANIMIGHYQKNLTPEIVGKYRKGDIRHCYADISKISKLGFKPTISLAEGIPELVEWVNLQPSCEVEDRFECSQKELEKRKLVK